MQKRINNDNGGTGKLAGMATHVRCAVGTAAPSDLLARHLCELAEAFAHSFARKWEAGRAFVGKDGELKWAAGRALNASEVEEIGCIYHAAFVGAYAGRAVVAADGSRRVIAGCGMAPASKRELYRAKENALPFRALLCWHRAYRAASKQVRSHLWGKGAEVCKVESLAVLEKVRQLAASWGARLKWQDGSEDVSGGMLGAWEAAAAVTRDGETVTASDGNAFPLGSVRVQSKLYGGAAALVDRARLRRELRHARWCLRAFWMLGMSRKWRTGFVADSALLGAAAAVIRGGGLEPLQRVALLNDSGTASNGALRMAVSRLRVRLAAGDLLLTEQPGRVAAAFATFLGVRRGGAAGRAILGQTFRAKGGVSICDEVRAAAAVTRWEATTLAAEAARVELVTLPESRRPASRREIRTASVRVNRRGIATRTAGVRWEIAPVSARLLLLGVGARRLSVSSVSPEKTSPLTIGPAVAAIPSLEAVARRAVDSFLLAILAEADARLAAKFRLEGKEWRAVTLPARVYADRTEGCYYPSTLRNGGFVWRSSAHEYNAERLAVRRARHLSAAARLDAGAFDVADLDEVRAWWGKRATQAARERRLVTVQRQRAQARRAFRVRRWSLRVKARAVGVDLVTYARTHRQAATAAH